MKVYRWHYLEFALDRESKSSPETNSATKKNKHPTEKTLDPVTWLYRGIIKGHISLGWRWVQLKRLLPQGSIYEGFKLEDHVCWPPTKTHLLHWKALGTLAVSMLSDCATSLRERGYQT
jgi:hypothetical protein